MRRGDCASVAGNMVIDGNGQFILCHALVAGQQQLEGQRIFHSWAQMQDVVFDYSNGKKIIMRKEKYYEIAKIKEEDIKKYNVDEVRKLLLKHRHWGPWDKELEKYHKEELKHANKM